MSVPRIRPWPGKGSGAGRSDPAAFFLTEKEDNYRLSLDQHLAARQCALEPLLEVSDTGFILDMVQRNLDCPSCPVRGGKQSVAGPAPYPPGTGFPYAHVPAAVLPQGQMADPGHESIPSAAVRENPPEDGEKIPDFPEIRRRTLARKGEYDIIVKR